MGLLNETVEIKLAGNVIKYYENLGYEIPRRLDKKGRMKVPKNQILTVKVTDLSKGSNVKVDISCDCCNKKYLLPYQIYLKTIHEGVIYCKQCNSYVRNKSQFLDCWKPNLTKEEEYNFIVKEYIQQSEERGKYLTDKEVDISNHFPNHQWIVKNCPDKTVKSWKDFVRWCGFYVPNSSTKDETIQFIYRMQRELGRTLKLTDFNGTGCYKVSMRGLKKYWKNLNDMKRELGLEVIQESMIDKVLTKEIFDKQIYKICEIAKKQNNIFTMAELSYHKDLSQENTLRKYAEKYYNVTLKEHLASYGVSIGSIGRGKVYYFLDGEITKSSHEYIFSSLLRESGYVFGVDYLRDVKYSSFISTYNGKMDCDYVLIKDSQKMYIEIAGMLRDYKNAYYNDKEIKSKTKEKYRCKLKEKEKMLRENKMQYILLFPNDLIDITLDDILELKS